MWLHNMANLPSERTNANFLMALMDPFGELTRESPKVTGSEINFFLRAPTGD